MTTSYKGPISNLLVPNIESHPKCWCLVKLEIRCIFVLKIKDQARNIFNLVSFCQYYMKHFQPQTAIDAENLLFRTAPLAFLCKCACIFHITISAFAAHRKRGWYKMKHSFLPLERSEAKVDCQSTTVSISNWRRLKGHVWLIYRMGLCII